MRDIMIVDRYAEFNSGINEITREAPDKDVRSSGYSGDYLVGTGGFLPWRNSLHQFSLIE